MDSNLESTFSNLPTTLQLDILKLLDWKDQKSLRLVCSHTLALVNYLGVSTNFEVNSKSIKKFKTSPFSLFQRVEISNLYEPLPIYSSTRFQISKTNRLTIGRNISFKNMLKLIRYYVKWCTTLCLHNTQVPFMTGAKTFPFGRSTCFTNVKNLHLHYSQTSCWSDKLYRLRTLGRFLNWSSMPALEELRINISQWETRIPILYRTQHHTFYENFPKFLIKHGPQLKYLQLSLIPIIWQHIFHTFEYMSNVQRLVVPNFYGYYDQDLILNAFKNFTKLTSLRFSPHIDRDELFGLLLANNKDTIQSFVWCGRLSSLSRLYKVQSSFGTLTNLYLWIQYGHSAIFDEAEIHNFKLEALRKLTIRIECNPTTILDWREPLCNWLVQVMPKLQELSLIYFSDFGAQPRISDVSSIIIGLSILRRIDFRSFSAKGYGISFTPIQPYISKRQLQQWLEQNPQTQVHKQKTSFGEAYSVYISRPYIQQPQEV